MHIRLRAVVLMGWMYAVCAQAAHLDYTTSWIGNTFGYGDGKWVQLNVEAISVAPDGTVFTNAPWDESGSEVAAYRNGDKLAVAGFTHGWGAHGGDAVASNSTYLYAGMSIDTEDGVLVGSDYPPRGQAWFGITRRQVSNIAKGVPFASGIGNSANSSKNSFVRLNAVRDGTDASVRGLAATETELFVANTYADRIEVLDANSMRRMRSFAVPSPGRIAIDADGSLWVIQGLRGDAGRSVAHYSPQGALLGAALALPAQAVPVDVAIAPDGRLLVADNGPSQQILVFSKPATGTAQLSGTIGTRAGIFHETAGVPGVMRFNGITGIGFDRAGNLYVAQNGFGPRAFASGLNGEGTVIESYNYAKRTLNWRLQGLTFVDGGDFDPASPRDVFSGSKHFKIDYSRPPGQEWSYAGSTLNRFAYPDDPAFHLPKGVRGEPMVRRLNGQRFLFTIDMYSHYLSVYRFQAGAQGETAIPSGLISQTPIPGDWPAGQPALGEFMWRDANGDGRVGASEIESNPSAGNTAANGFWWVDSAGDVWMGTLVSGIRKMPLQGFDAAGNPVYRYSASTVFPMPAPFTRIARIVYVAETDTLYVTGFTSGYPYDASHWKEAGRVLARYDRWSSGHPSLQYTIALPWTVDASPQVTTVGVAVAGSHIFVAELYTARVDIYDNRTGQFIGSMTPGPEVGGTGGWVDVYLGISAARRDNGEYVVLVEDDARAKILMYRWKP